MVGIVSSLVEERECELWLGWVRRRFLGKKGRGREADYKQGTRVNMMAQRKV